MRRRLVIAVGSVTAAALVLLAVPLVLTLKRNYEDEELLKLQRDTVSATRSIDVAQPGDPIELPSTSDRLSVFDAAGQPLAGDRSRAANALINEALATGRIQAESSGGQLRVAAPLVTKERVSGAVLAERDDSVVDSRSRRAWLAIAGLALGIFFLAIAAAVLVSRRLARPLEGLAADAKRLGSGDFSVRAKRSGIPETDAVATALDATAERLGEAVTREREFSSDASHQLRTPLAALRLELESMALADGPNEATARAIEQVERLDRTVETLLAAARDTSGGTELVDVEEVLRELEQRWRGPLAEAGRPLRVRNSAHAHRARFAHAVLAEVLNVLVDNALRHGSGEVTVTARDASGALAIDVADEGSGFSDPVAAFERGSTTGGGLGIGLALAQSLARAEGAELRASRAGPGPILTLFLRVADSPEPNSAKAKGQA